MLDALVEQEITLDLHHLRTFVTVARARHLTRAAERLNLSQPAASAHIKALEDALALPLFFRRPGGLELTPAGLTLLARAERLLFDAAGFVAEARQLIGQVTGRLRIGSIPEPELLRIGPLMAQLRALHPLLEVDVQQRNSRSSIEGVRNAELDACFALGQSGDSSLAAIELAELDYVVTAPRAWKNKLCGWSLRDIATAPWVLPPPEGAHDQMIGQLFRERGLEPVPAIRANNELIIRAFVIAGLGFGLLREDVARRDESDGLVAIADGHRTRMKLLFAYLADRAGDPLIKAIANVVRVSREKHGPAGID